jgi:4-diphosphocytidyl-2C-methyl-D-erythritol kinase
MAVEETAPAKLNLALHVTGRRADGYHLLDSLADVDSQSRFPRQIPTFPEPG